MPYVNGILGRLASNPELVATKKGGYMCNFIIANDCGYGDHKQTDFVRCVAFNKTGETISRYFKKGDAIIVQGEMHNRPYQKNDKGYDIPNWQYTVNSVVFLPRAKQVWAHELIADVQKDGEFVEMDSMDSSDMPF